MVVDAKRNFSEDRTLYLDNQAAINTAIDEVAERGHPLLFVRQVVANLSSLVIHNLFCFREIVLFVNFVVNVEVKLVSHWAI